MYQFTLDTIVTDTQNLKVYSVSTTNDKPHKGLAVNHEGKIFLLHSTEPFGWLQPGKRGSAPVNYHADQSVIIEEWQFNEAIASIQALGVQKIAASAMRIVFAENNNLRARYMGARREKNTFTMPWVRFTNKTISTGNLRLLGATAKCLANLLANGYLKEAKEPNDT